MELKILVIILLLITLFLQAINIIIQVYIPVLIERRKKIFLDEELLNLQKMHPSPFVIYKIIDADIKNIIEKGITKKIYVTRKDVISEYNDFIVKNL